MGNKLAQPDRHTISSLTLQKGTKWRTNGVIDLSLYENICNMIYWKYMHGNSHMNYL